MFSAGIVEAIDVLKEGITDLLSCCPSVPPDQFGFKGFEAVLVSHDEHLFGESLWRRRFRVTYLPKPGLELFL